MPSRTSKPFTLTGKPQEIPNLWAIAVPRLMQGNGTAESFVQVPEPLPLQIPPLPYRNLTDGKR